MRSLSPLSRRILKKAGIAAAFFCSAFLFGSVLSHFTCRALRKAAPVFLSAAPETPVSSVSMPVLSSAAENWGLSFPEKGKTPVGNATSEELAAYNAWFAASPEENIIYLTFDRPSDTFRGKKRDVKTDFQRKPAGHLYHERI